jgi:hypothetical protein
MDMERQGYGWRPQVRERDARTREYECVKGRI